MSAILLLLWLVKCWWIVDVLFVKPCVKLPANFRIKELDNVKTYSVFTIGTIVINFFLLVLCILVHYGLKYNAFICISRNSEHRSRSPQPLPPPSPQKTKQNKTKTKNKKPKKKLPRRVVPNGIIYTPSNKEKREQYTDWVAHPKPTKIGPVLNFQPLDCERLSTNDTGELLLSDSFSDDGHLHRISVPGVVIINTHNCDLLQFFLNNDTSLVFYSIFCLYLFLHLGFSVKDIYYR